MVEETLKNLNLTKFNLQIACSGGLASTVLVHACVAIGLLPQIVHVNYQLRGESSRLDELHVRKLAKDYNLEINVIHCPKELTSGKGLNLQNEARKFRHNLFSDFISKHPLNKVLLAHHKDDQVETFFLQLARNSGIYGLGGMHPESIGIIRPFLYLSKADILNYALKNNIQWREDESNSQLKYRRNLLRNALLPYLEFQHPQLKESVLLIQQVFREQQKMVQQNLMKSLEHWTKSAEIQYNEWNNLNFDEKITIIKHFSWPSWIIERIDELEKCPLSAEIENSPIFKSKDGFCWKGETYFKDNWEITLEAIGIQEITDSKWTFAFDNLWHKEQFHISHATNQTPFVKSVKTTVFKLLKDAGIPKQLRAIYPILFYKDNAVWIPGIAYSKEATKVNKTELIAIFKVSIK